MTSEVEGLDLDALEKVARAATQGDREAWSSIYEGMTAAIVVPGCDPLKTIAEVRSHYDDAVFLSTFDPPTVLRLLAALRAQAERVRVLEGERDEARGVVRETLWMARRYADGRQTYAVGMFNDAAMLAVAGGYASGEPDGTMFARDGRMPEYRAAEARAEAAERRAGEAEARVIAEMQYANASRNIAARLHGALAEIARGDVPPEKEGHYRAHREAVRIARAALLPATQAEGEK